MIVLLMAGFSLAGQDKDGMAEIMRLLGAESPEDVDEEVVERLADYLRSPLKINQSSLSKLMDSGLMDRYRAISLVDYRSRHGDILSISELSYVDGFGEFLAYALEPFISLDTHMTPGARKRDRDQIGIDISYKGGGKYSGTTEWMSGLKSRIEYGEKLTASFALTSPYGRFSPDDFNYSAGVLLNFPSLKSRLLLGDFNARFGQGLAIWNGLSLGSLSSPSAFMKNPTGLSSASSFTGNHAFTGIGVETILGSFVISGSVSLPDLKYDGKQFRVFPVLNLSRYGRYGHVAVTHAALLSIGSVRLGHISSLDTRWCINGIDVFGECAFDWVNETAAAIAGTIVPAGESVRLAAVLRYYPASFKSEYSSAMYSVSSATNEYSMSVSSELNIMKKHRLVLTADAAHLPSAKKGDRGGSMQFKGLLTWEGNILDWLTLKARVAERYRTWGEPLRTDARVDILSEMGDYRVNLRLNALSCSDVGLLSYLEGGYVRNHISVWLRQGFFKIDDWDDRIYVYERSAPGSFKVPAYYGRGLWSALMFSTRVSRLCRLYLRTSYTAYPFMPAQKRKPGKAELELYSVFSF